MTIGLTDFAPVRVQVAESRDEVVSRCPIGRGAQSQEMSQNCVDTRSRIQIQRVFHRWNLGKLPNLENSR